MMVGISVYGFVQYMQSMIDTKLLHQLHNILCFYMQPTCTIAFNSITRLMVGGKQKQHNHLI